MLCNLVRECSNGEHRIDSTGRWHQAGVGDVELSDLVRPAIGANRPLPSIRGEYKSRPKGRRLGAAGSHERAEERLHGRVFQGPEVDATVEMNRNPSSPTVE